MIRRIVATIVIVAVSVDAYAQPPSNVDGFPLPPGAVHRFGNRQLRNPDPIIGSAVSPDGKLLATLGSNGVVVWDLQSLRKLTLSDGFFGGYGFGDRNLNLAFFPDSKSLLVTVRPTDRTSMTVNELVELAQVWDLETGKKKFGLKGGWGFAYFSWLVADGKEIALLAGYRQEATIKCFDSKDGKELRSVKVPLMNRGGWAAPNGSLFASLTDNSDGLRITNTKTGEETQTVAGARMIQAAISRDAKQLAFHDESGKVHLYDLEAKKELFTFDHPAEKQRGPMTFSKDQQTLYFGGQYGQLYRWDLKNNKRLPDVGRHSSWTLSTISLSPDESILYSMGGDKLIRRWNLKTGQQLPVPEGYITQTAVVPTTDGQNLIVADHAGAIDYWDLATGKHVKRLQEQKTGGIDCVAISPDGRWLAGGRTVQDVQLWDLQAGKLERVIPLVDKPDDKGGDHVKRVFFSADGKVLYTGSGKTGITAWEVPTGKKIWNVPDSGHVGACDPAGRWVAVSSGFNSEQMRWTLIDAKTGQVLRRVDLVQEEVNDPHEVHYPGYITDLTFTPDGSRLITGHYNGMAQVWNLETTKVITRMRGKGQLQGIACSRDGRWIACARSDRKISVWELATGKEAYVLEGHQSVPRDVAFTRDGHGIIGNADLAPTLWNLDPKSAAENSLTTDERWETLASDNGAKAYRLEWALANDSTAAVKLFHERIKPADLKADRPQFDKWLAALDSPQFRAREAAEKSMLQAGPKIPVAWMRQALTTAMSDEVRARLQRVLAEREKPNPLEWRLGRVVQVLELAGNDEAKTLLKEWADAGAGTLSLDAKAALDRLAK